MEFEEVANKVKEIMESECFKRQKCNGCEYFNTNTICCEIQENGGKSRKELLI